VSQRSLVSFLRNTVVIINSISVRAEGFKLDEAHNSNLLQYLIKAFCGPMCPALLRHDPGCRTIPVKQSASTASIGCHFSSKAETSKGGRPNSLDRNGNDNGGFQIWYVRT
jgi:hypothetical protein